MTDSAIAASMVFLSLWNLYVSLVIARLTRQIEGK